MRDQKRRHLSLDQREAHQCVTRGFTPNAKRKARRLARDVVRCEGCGAWMETAYFSWGNQFWCDDCREESPVRDFRSVESRVNASEDEGDLISEAHKAVRRSHPLHNWFEIDPSQTWWRK